MTDHCESVSLLTWTIRAWLFCPFNHTNASNILCRDDSWGHSSTEEQIPFTAANALWGHNVARLKHCCPLVTGCSTGHTPMIWIKPQSFKYIFPKDSLPFKVVLVHFKVFIYGVILVLWFWKYMNDCWPFYSPGFEDSRCCLVLVHIWGLGEYLNN